MTAFLNWLAGIIARWLNPKDKPVTTATITLTSAESAIATTTSAVVSELGALGGDVAVFWNALVAAAAPKFTNLTSDAMAGGAFLVVLTEVAADIPSPISGAAALALTAEKLALVNIPRVVALGRLLAVLAGLSGIDLHGAIPGVSAAEGGYPRAPSGGNRGPTAQW